MAVKKITDQEKQNIINASVQNMQSRKHGSAAEMQKALVSPIVNTTDQPSLDKVVDRVIADVNSDLRTIPLLLVTALTPIDRKQIGETDTLTTMDFNRPPVVGETFSTSSYSVGGKGFVCQAKVTKVVGTTVYFTYTKIVESQCDSGVTIHVDGFFSLAVDANGDLWSYSANDTPYNFEYDEETGNLYLLQAVDYKEDDTSGDGELVADLTMSEVRAYVEGVVELINESLETIPLQPKDVIDFCEGSVTVGSTCGTSIYNFNRPPKVGESFQIHGRKGNDIYLLVCSCENVENNQAIYSITESILCFDDDCVPQNYVDNLPDYLTLTETQKVKWGDFLGFNQQFAVINAILSQSGLVSEYKAMLEDTYTERVTADGANVLDGSKAVLKTLEGSTVACKQLFDLSKIEATPSNIRSWISSVGENIIKITTGSLEGTSFNGYTATTKSLQTLCPSLRAGDTVYVYFETTATVGENIKHVYISGLGVIAIGKAVTITEESLSMPLVFYCDITPNTITEITNFIITKEQNAPWQPYFTGLKSASFAGIESKNADGTETSTLVFPKTETPLGLKIDFENKKIMDYGVEIVLTGSESFISLPLPYVSGGSSHNVRSEFILPTVETYALGVCTDARVILNGNFDAGDLSIGIGDGARYIVWARILDQLGYTVSGQEYTNEELEAAIIQFKGWLSKRYSNGNPVTIRYISSTLQSETAFTAEQKTKLNFYIDEKGNNEGAWNLAYKDGTEKVLDNDGAEYGADNMLTQNYIIVNKVD